MKVNEIANLLGASLVVPEGMSAEVEILKLAPINQAAEGDLTFLSNPDYAKFLSETKATAVIVAKEYEGLPLIQLVHSNPYMCFARIGGEYFKYDHGPVSISEKAHIESSAKIGSNVTIFPFVYVGENVEVADGAVLYPGVYLGKGSKVGKNTVLFANVVLERDCIIGDDCIIHAGVVIGADGFGFAPGDGKIIKIPQVGIARVGDNVELGSVTTIDRAAMGETTVADGCKIDSKVHIAHNVSVGENCMFSALTGLAGSAKVGNWVVLGGQVGVNGHIEVKDGVQVGAKAGIVKSTGEKETLMGFPAVPADQWRRLKVSEKRLPDMAKRLKQLERRLEALENQN